LQLFYKFGNSVFIGTEFDEFVMDIFEGIGPPLDKLFRIFEDVFQIAGPLCKNA
jgi:hypothetical protein